MPKRKPIFNKRETPEGYEINFHSIEPSVPNFDFSKPPARKPNPASPLPCFMHATCSRMALDTHTQKTYVMNCTNDSFMTAAPLGHSFAGTSFSKDED